METRTQRLGAWLRRWQEFMGWLPALVVLGIVAYLVIGAWSRENQEGALGALVELPVIAAYAGAAAGFVYLSWRRYRMGLTHDELEDYWRRLMAGDRGAIVVCFVNAAVYLSCFVGWLLFFSPAR